MKKYCVFPILILLLGSIGYFLIKRNREARPYWIVYVVIDTLRADHLHCYGYPRDTSPFIDSIAKEGIVFTNAYSHSSTTAPSHSTMFTSLYPYQHEVYSNKYVLKDKYLTLAEYLKTKGYFTAAVVSVPWLKNLNLNQGFEIFDYPEDVKIYPSGHYRPATSTVTQALKIIEKNKLYAQKTFLWVHLFDPHIPLIPPQSLVNRLRNSEKKKDMIKYLIDTQKIQLEPHDNDLNRLYDYILRYDAEVLYVDTELCRLYSFLRKKLNKKKVLWIITSDHGEGLGAHNWLLHAKYIYTELVHVPLIFVWWNYEIPPGRINTIVGHIDLFPTIADLLGDNLKAIVKSIKGHSILPLILKKEKYVRKYIFAERQRNRKNDILCSLRSLNYSYFFRLNGPDEFYDLRKDPYENINIIRKNPPVLNKFKALISRKIIALRRTQRRKNKRLKNEKILERLKTLGYVE